MSAKRVLSVTLVMIVACFLFCCLISSEQAYGIGICEIYVDASYSNGDSDGSIDKPFQTIQDALDVSVSDCTIYVQTGNYYGTIENYSFNHISIVSQDPNHPEQTVINGDVIFNGVTGSRLDGFTVAESEASGIHCWGDTNTVINRCIIRQNGWDGIFIFEGDVQVNHCVIWNNHDFGVYCAQEARAVILNSIVWENRAGGVQKWCERASIEARFCIMQGHTQMDPVDGRALINADPLFVNADPRNWPPFDFHLRSIAGGDGVDSPAIDTGTGDGEHNDFDTDIGVYQGYERIAPMVIPQHKVLEQGAEFTFTAFGGNEPYVWKSSDPNVASIDSNTGNVTAKRPGFTRITAKETSAYGAEGVPALLVVGYPGDAFLMKEDPNSSDLSHAYTAYTASGDHLGIALTRLAVHLDQPDPNVRALLEGLDVTYGGIFNLGDPNMTYGPRKCWDMDSNAPGLDQIQQVIHGSIIPYIEEAITELDMIQDPNYKRYIGGEDDVLFDDSDDQDDILEINISEVYLVKAGMHATHALLDVFGAYVLWDSDMDYCDLDSPFVNPNNGEPIPDAVNDFMADHPEILTILDGDRMESALGHIRTAIGLVRDGFNALKSEEDLAYDDLLSYGMLELEKGEDEEFLDTLDDLEQALDPNTPPATVYMDHLIPQDCTPIRVDLSKFFRNPPDRTDLPDFNSENDPDLDTIPDPTLNGILPGMGLARLNGLILDDMMDAWGWQEWYPDCHNVIQWWLEDPDEIADFQTLSIYRSEDPCVDPNSTPLVTYGPDTIYMVLDDEILGFMEEGHGIYFRYDDYDIGDCNLEKTYFYLVVAGFANPQTELRSRILMIRNDTRPCDGDVNWNGRVTPLDALCALEKYIGIENTSCDMPSSDVCCDVNMDFVCTPRDALCIFRHYLGMPSCLDWYDPYQNGDDIVMRDSMTKFLD